MADINSIKDASGKTINDYKADYAAAAARGDDVAMKAANKAANDIRESQGQAKQEATADIAKVQSGGQSGIVTDPGRWDTGSSSGGSSGAGSVPEGFRGSAVGVGTYTQEQDRIKAQMNENSAKWHTAPDGDRATPGTKGWYEDQNKALAAQLGGTVSDSFDPVTGTWGGTAAKPVQLPQVSPQSQGASHADTAALQALLDQWRDAAVTQNNNSVNYAVEKAVADLQRALEDSKVQFKEQQESVARDERQALDNSALYSELRGDKGGIGKEQYSSIMNTAAQNRLLVQQEQTKLATETQRQIADLRAKGEFEKADAVLEIAQTYLSQLINLEQWAAEYNLSVDQFNESIRQWEAEFSQAVDQYKANQDLAIAELTGKLSDGTTTLQAQNLIRQQLASSGESLLAYGILPSDEQLEAMGMTRAQAQQLVTAAQLKAAQDAAKPGDSSLKAQLEAVGLDGIYQHLFDQGYTNKSADSVKSYLLSIGFNSTQAGAYADAYTGEQYRAIKDSREQAERHENGYVALVKELGTLEDRVGKAAVPSQAALMIQAAAVAGNISEEQAEKLLAQYGIEV